MRDRPRFPDDKETKVTDRPCFPAQVNESNCLLSDSFFFGLPGDPRHVRLPGIGSMGSGQEKKHLFGCTRQIDAIAEYCSSGHTARNVKKSLTSSIDTDLGSLLFVKD